MVGKVFILKRYNSFKDLVLFGDEDLRAAFAAYLKYLRSQAGSTFPEASVGSELEEHTLYRLFRGERVGVKNAEKIESLILYFRQYVKEPKGKDDLSEIDKFEEWLGGYQPSNDPPQDNGASTEPTSDNSPIMSEGDTAGPNGTVEEAPKEPVSHEAREFAHVYEHWSDEERRLFGKYLQYLRDLSPNNTTSGASSALGFKSSRTILRAMDGQRLSRESAVKIHSLVSYFSEGVNDGVEVDDFETWIRAHQASGKKNTSRNSVFRRKWFWIGGGGALAAFAAAFVLLRFACVLPGKCSPQNIDYWGIQTDYFMRVNHNGYAMQEKFSGPRIVRLREPIIYFESDHRIGFADANVTFINRTDGSVIETHEFEGDAKTYRQPYVDDRTVSADFDFEVVECFAVHLEDEDRWVREFRVKQPDAQRLKDLVTQERYEDFNLVTVFDPDPIFSRSELECPADIRSDPSYLEFQNSGLGEPHIDIEEIYAEALGDVENPINTAKEDLSPQFDVVWFGGSINIWVRKIDGLPENAQFEVSRDGSNFTQGGNLSNFAPTDQYLIRLNHWQWPSHVGPFDFTEEAREHARQAVETAMQDDAIRCRPGACEIRQNEFCNGNWSELTLGRSPDAEEVSLDLISCDAPGLQAGCLSAPRDLFPFNPGQTLYGKLSAVGGGTYHVEFPSRPLWGRFQEGAPAVTLLPLTDGAPSAFAVYETYAGGSEVRYAMQVAAGSCGGLTALEDQFRAIYYDVDGKGNVRGELRYFSIREPERDFIEITLEGKDGASYGPYRYAFPSEEIIGNAIAPIERASTFECRRKLSNRFDVKSWFYYCYAPSTYQTIFEWADVSEVQIGSSPDNLSEVMKVDLTNREIVELHTQTRQGVVPPVFEYKPPNDQRDLYFSIVYKDGTRTMVQRLELPDPL